MVVQSVLGKEESGGISSISLFVSPGGIFLKMCAPRK
jgi:hypothetical protein